MLSAKNITRQRGEDVTILPSMMLFTILFFLLTINPWSVFGQSNGQQVLQAAPIISGNSVYLSRYNQRVYINGSYRGLRYTEISGQIEEAGRDLYRANFWYTSSTGHDLRSNIAAVDRSLRSTLSTEDLIYSSLPLSGALPEQLYKMPEYRNFPVLPVSALGSIDGPGLPREGDSWEAFAYRLVDPDGDGTYTPLQILVRYVYRGTGEYLGETVHFIDADYALRSSDSRLPFSVQGRNEVRIAIFPGENVRIFMNNNLDEQYRLRDGRTIALQGFGLTWIKSPRPVSGDDYFLRGIASYTESQTAEEIPLRISALPDAPSQVPDPNSVSRPASEADDTAPVNTTSPTSSNPTSPTDAESPEPQSESPLTIQSDSGTIELSQTELGVSLNLPDIKFEPDSARLLPGEQSRIALLVELLKQAGDRRFLVVGHTADIGYPEGQMELSIQRAATVAALLAEAGIPPGAIRYEGRGATEPVGDNATWEGRSQNRRVEVIILNY